MAGEAQMAVDGKARRQPSRGMYVLPSLFTAGNMAAGYYAITQSIQGSAADHWLEVVQAFITAEKKMLKAQTQ